MPESHLVLNTKDTERAIRRLKERAPQAIVRALNRSIASAATVAIRIISADTGIKQADLKGTSPRNTRISTRQATATVHKASLVASAKPIPLIDYGAKGPYPSRGKGRGVTAKLRGGARRYPYAFIAEVGKGKHRGVFQRGATLDAISAYTGRVALKTSLTKPGKRSSRAGRERDAFGRFIRVTSAAKGDRKSHGAWSFNLPIYELHGPSIAYVFERKAAGPALARGQEQLVKNLAHEFRFATGGSAAAPAAEFPIQVAS